MEAEVMVAIDYARHLNRQGDMEVVDVINRFEYALGVIITLEYDLLVRVKIRHTMISEVPIIINESNELVINLEYFEEMLNSDGLEKSFITRVKNVMNAWVK